MNKKTEKKEQIHQAVVEWLDEHRATVDRKRKYMVVYRRRKKLGT